MSRFTILTGFNNSESFILSEMYVRDPDENIWWIFVLNDSDSDDSDSDFDDVDSEGTSGGEH